MIGVDYDLFWTLNPKSLSPFIKAFDLSRERDSYIAWEIGVYVKKAITSSLDAKDKYPKEPFGVKKLKAKKSDEMPMEDIKARFMNQMELMNSRFTQ